MQLICSDVFHVSLRVQAVTAAAVGAMVPGSTGAAFTGQPLRRLWPRLSQYVAGVRCLRRCKQGASPLHKLSTRASGIHCGVT